MPGTIPYKSCSACLHIHPTAQPAAAAALLRLPLVVAVAGLQAAAAGSLSQQQRLQSVAEALSPGRPVDQPACLLVATWMCPAALPVPLAVTDGVLGPLLGHVHLVTDLRNALTTCQQTHCYWRQCCHRHCYCQ